MNDSAFVFTVGEPPMPNDQGMEIAASVAERMNVQLRENQERTAKANAEQRRKQKESDEKVDEIVARAAANLNRGSSSSEPDEGDFLEDPNGHKTTSDVEFVTEEELIERDKDIIK